MTEPIVRVEGIGKRYKIGAAQGKNTTLKTALTAVPRNAFLRLKGGHTRTEEFWALRDVDLDIAQGDVVGLVGRNGAGKSTLLKILSRIVEPTTGRAILDGRVASILEVGTGFHEELTGRENIYLNGAILGMRRREIQTKFDEIVEFAEIEKFLDTPVKFFSSGMYVRLAFAIAAHLDPDILIVDEVLAVGDEEFQKKSLGKMSSVARSGRTVIFVSHNTTALLDLCDHGVLLESGRIKRTGLIDDVVAAYTEQNANRGSGRFLRPAFDPATQVLTAVELSSEDGATTDVFAVRRRAAHPTRDERRGGPGIRPRAQGQERAAPTCRLCEQLDHPARTLPWRRDDRGYAAVPRSRRGDVSRRLHLPHPRARARRHVVRRRDVQCRRRAAGHVAREPEGDRRARFRRARGRDVQRLLSTVTAPTQLHVDGHGAQSEREHEQTRQDPALPPAGSGSHRADKIGPPGGGVAGRDRTSTSRPQLVRRRLAAAAASAAARLSDEIPSSPRPASRRRPGRRRRSGRSRR